MKITSKQLRQIIREELTRAAVNEMDFPWEDAPPKYAATPLSNYLEDAAARLKSSMVSRAQGQEGFDEDNLHVVVGPSKSPRDAALGRSKTGDSWGDMIVRVYFARGDFPVVKGARGMGVWSSKEELIGATDAALLAAAGGRAAPTVKDATIISVGYDPERSTTMGWQMTLSPPLDAGR